jgi:hypothetical protein
MRGAFLSVSIENSEFMLPAAIEALANGELQRHDQVHQVCTLFRQRGLSQMLRDGVARGVHVAAMQSCGALVFGLRDWPESTKVTSYANPLFDAIACRYWDGAAAIAEASRMSWNPDYEYEDDFLYVRFVIEFALHRNPHAAQRSLERYAEVLDGPADARLEVCQALLASDAAAFDEALVRLLDERDERVQGFIRRGAISDDAARWLAHVSVEGLALLAIAEREGLETAEHYLHCPAVARRPSPWCYDPDAWRSLHYAPLLHSAG